MKRNKRRPDEALGRIFTSLGATVRHAPQNLRDWFVWVAALQVSLFVGARITLFTGGADRALSDSWVWIAMSNMSLFDSELWAGLRPLGVPLAWKVMAIVPGGRTTEQLVLSIVAWSTLSLAVAGIPRARVSRAVVFFSALLLGLSPAIVVWDRIPMSESVSISALALLLAALIWWVRRRTKLSLSFLVSVVVFAGLARDTNAIMLLAAIVFLLPLLWTSIPRRHIYVLGITCVATFIVASLSLTGGMRWQGPYQHVLEIRIIPAEERLAFFVRRGFPIDEVSVEKNPRPKDDPDSRRTCIWDGACGDVVDEWMSKSAIRTYQLFLLANPIYTLRAPLEDRQGLEFRQSFLWSQIDPYYPPGLAPKLLHWWPWFAREERLWWVIAVAVLLSLALGVVWGNRSAVSLSIVMIVLGIAYYYLAWHGDDTDIIRHSLPGSILSKFGILLAEVALVTAVERWVSLARHKIQSLRTTIPIGNHVHSPRLICYQDRNTGDILDARQPLAALDSNSASMLIQCTVCRQIWWQKDARTPAQYREPTPDEAAIIRTVNDLRRGPLFRIKNSRLFT